MTDWFTTRLGARALAACGVAALLLASCAEPAARATAPGEREDSAPLTAACDELARLHTLETGQAPARSALAPDSTRVAELFRRAGAFGLDGGFLIARRGEVVAQAACGLADSARGVPMTLDAVFDIGSLSKQFTAAAVLALADDGRLAPTDSITRFFPDVPPDKRGITLHQLLTHTAGFVHDVGDPETQPSRDDAVREILASELRFAPGTGQAYSNSGYALLAAVVEIAAGQDFERFLRERLWLPLGMTRTGMVLGDRTGATLAMGSTFSGLEEGRRPALWGPDGPSWLARGSGFVSSTLPELLTWTEALRTGRVLSHEARRQMFWPQARESVPFVSFYGYGWEITAAPEGSGLVTHNGSSGIHYAVLGILPEHDMVYVAFCTQQATAWKDFPERVLGVLDGGDDLGFPDVGVAGEPLSAFAGRFRLPDGGELELRATGGRLSVVNGVESLRLFDPWPPADPATVEALGDRSALVSSVMDGIARGDLEPLAEHLKPDIPLADERTFWSEYWPRWVEQWGEYRGADVIDTVIVDGTPRTLVLIRFARAGMVVGFVHEAGGLFVDTMSRRLLPEIGLAPVGGREFQSFHPLTRRATRVVFGDEGEARSLSIEGTDVKAVRVAR